MPFRSVIVRATALLAVAILLPPSPAASTQTEDHYIEVARKAADWIRKSSIKTDHGIVWPSDPGDTSSISLTLYGGSPGIILFLLELHHATGDPSYLEDARSGADHLVASLDSVQESGLYTGIAGVGLALLETFQSTGERKYRDGASRCVALIKNRARPAGKGVEWSDVTDIIGGIAGTGLFLLRAAAALDDPSARKLAERAGRRLIELGKPDQGGLKWAMNPTFERLMPNFSHGTAGIAYFLATLYTETRRKEFLDAAQAGAKYLKAVATLDNDACLIFHHEPGGEDLYYLGWCHGPAGTARFFHRMYQVTGDRTWIEWVRRSARAILHSGIPEERTPGFWNNVSQCCGSAGVADFFLSLHQAMGEKQYLEFSMFMTADLLRRSTTDESGSKWIQAEHRVRPELLVAQTGYMQGAAGMGMLLVRLSNFANGRKHRIALPDSPFS